MPDPHIHPDPGRWPAGAPLDPLDLAGERHKPAATLLADGGRQDPRGPLLQATAELAGGLVGLEAPQPRQGHMVAVGLHPDRAGGKPARQAAVALAFAAGEPHAGAGAAALLGIGP